MRLAAVDIGTNTVRMLVADIEGALVLEVDRAVDVVGLGKGISQSGMIAPESMTDAVAVLTGYGQRIWAMNPLRIRVVATSASREASNSGELVERIEAALGLTPDIVSGEEEACLAFAGAVWGAGSAGRHLVIDVGGGSTEFVSGHDSPETAVSIDIGSVRLTDRLLVARPPEPGGVECARLAVREMFGSVPIPDPHVNAIGVAGTFTSLAAIHLGLARYQRERVHRAVLSLGDLDDLVMVLSGMTLSETESIPSLDPKRASVILAGAVIAAEAVRRSGSDSVTVSETDILEGIVLTLSRE